MNTSKHNQQLANLEGDLSLQHLRFAGVLVPIALVLPKLKLIVQPEIALRIGFKSIEKIQTKLYKQFVKCVRYVQCKRLIDCQFDLIFMRRSAAVKMIP